MMQTIQTPGSKEHGYGFGYYIRNNDKGIRMVEHDGGVAGYEAMMVFNPASGTGVIMMRNYDFGLTNILLEPRSLLAKIVNHTQPDR
jgi:CubicO group peptidase (beta-lactamase class C family)